METAADNLGIVREAIARSAGVVLSLPSPAGLRHHKSRFLADAGDGFWCTSVTEERDLVRDLIASRQPAGVSFRSGDAKVIFATEIQHWMPDYAIARAGDQDVGATVEALLLRFPTAVRSIQRRKSFRVPVDGTTGLEAKVWTMSGTASLRDKPVASREISCDVRDISVGGVGLLIRAAAGRPPAVASGDRIRVQLTLGRTVVLLEGQLRYPPCATKDSTFRAGVQFLSFGESKEERAASAELGKIVNQLQRELIRRKKLGLPVPAA